MSVTKSLSRLLDILHSQGVNAYGSISIEQQRAVSDDPDLSETATLELGVTASEGAVEDLLNQFAAGVLDDVDYRGGGES